MTATAFANSSESVSQHDAPLLELREVSKQFPGVLALDRISFVLKPGEVHVLFGENGAGKSTAISIMAGVFRPTDGQILFRGKPVQLGSVHHARELGISAVFQEFSLIGQLTVEQNMFLGAEPTSCGMLNRKALHIEAERILKELGFPLSPTQKVDYLSRAEQQMVEIAKAFRSEPAVLILDEPTASLTERETEQLFALIERLQERGVGVIYITHRMSEIHRIADRVTVLRDGALVGTVDAAQTSEEELVSLMTGRVIEQIYPTIRYSPTDEVLGITDLTTADGRVRKASVSARGGEVVGLAGLIGSGKSELLRACFGIATVSSGTVTFNGEDVTGKSTREMLNRGFFYMPSDRREEGLVMIRNCRENIALPSLHLSQFQRWGLLRRSHERDTAQELAGRLQLHPLRIERNVNQFSGGNQQKVMLAKCLVQDVRLYVFDEPTVGVDVGTRAEIYRFIAQLCEDGAAVIVISSDLQEVLHISHRLYVMHRGRVQAQLTGDEITQEQVLHNFFDKEVA